MAELLANTFLKLVAFEHTTDGTVTFRSPVQPANTVLATVLAFAPKYTVSNAVQFLNALAPRAVLNSGRDIPVKDAQPSNAFAPTSTTLGSSIATNVEFLNADCWIHETFKNSNFPNDLS